MCFSINSRAGQEFLAYMSLIRIYDNKFRCKAALSPTVNWSNIDQQLWLIIFTTSLDTLAQQYPIFFQMDPISSLPQGLREGATVMSTIDKGTVPDNFVNTAMYATHAVACLKEPKPLQEEPPSKCCSKPSKAKRN